MSVASLLIVDRKRRIKQITSIPSYHDCQGFRNRRKRLTPSRTNNPLLKNTAVFVHIFFPAKFVGVRFPLSAASDQHGTPKWRHIRWVNHPVRINTQKFGGCVPHPSNTQDTALLKLICVRHSSRCTCKHAHMSQLFESADVVG